MNAGFHGGKFKLRSGGLGFLKLFGFEDETGALVKVNASVAGGAVGVLFNDGELEKISLAGCGSGRGTSSRSHSSSRNGCEFARSDALAADQCEMKS